MRFTVRYPVVLRDHAPEIRRAAAIAQFARYAEDVGFDAVAVGERPAPPHAWVAAGGHPAFDPIAVLACAAVNTTRLRLLPYALVLPYRNPLLLAKALATLDAVSAGRLLVGAAVGHVASEFAAVGAPFDERNELFDEAVAAMVAIWGGEDVAVAGRHFRAAGQTAEPRPVHRPPFWIAGNSTRSRQRAAVVGAAWMPRLLDAEAAREARTAPLPDVAALGAAIADLRRLVAAVGRPADDVVVQVEAVESGVLREGALADFGAHRALLAELEAAGAGQFVVDTPARTLSEALGALERYGRRVINT